MENTLGNKAKFFSMYWGQEVLVDSTNNYIAVCPEVFQEFQGCGLCSDNDRNEILRESYLELTPLLQISDEDAINVYYIMMGKETSTSNEDKIYLGRSFCSGYDTSNTDLEFNQTYLDIQQTIDFLRSRSHALPWMDLSVEEQIQYGWVKLKEVK